MSIIPPSVNMPGLVQRALSARRESKHIEFKQAFDPCSASDWCAIVKDIVAIANSGGGIIIFGLDNVGTPTGQPIDAVAKVDPADVANKVGKYTGTVGLELEILEVSKESHPLVAFLIHAASTPFVFEKPGQYDVGGGKQRTAFGMGTVYFRHGAKSEPGSTSDIRMAVEHSVEVIRKSWIKGVRKVVQAPPGSQIVIAHSMNKSFSRTEPAEAAVRVVTDPGAPTVFLTRDASKASTRLIHEAVSEGIFDEINNVVEANRALAKEQQVFFLGPAVYHRIYAEREYVRQADEEIALLP